MDVIAQYQIAKNRRVQIRDWHDGIFTIATQQDARECTLYWERYKPDGWRDCITSVATDLDTAILEAMEHIASEKRFVQMDADAPHWHWRC